MGAKVLDIYGDLGQYLDKRPLYQDKLTDELYSFLFCLLFGDWEGLGMKAKVQLPQSKALSKHKLLSHQLQSGKLMGVDGWEGTKGTHLGGGPFL